jgi:lipid A 3-O-deacylase
VAKIRRHTAVLIVIIAALAPPSAAGAADVPERGTLSLVFENDLFHNEDGRYTSGVRLSWLSSPGTGPEWAVRLAPWFPLFPDGGTIRTRYAHGQNIFTPSKIKLEDPAPDDRPYAGWLYGSIGLIAETGQRLDVLDLTLGIVGPASLAKETQRFTHKITGANEPRGWGTQLENEPGIVLTYQRIWRAFETELTPGLGFDLVPHAGGALGNVYTYANAGVTLRFGTHPSLDYGVPRIQPSLSGSSFFVGRRGAGWYLFAGAEARAIARNIFLDGNTFRDSRSVDKEPLVGDLQFGVALTFRSMRISYTHVLRTKEFEGEGGGSDFGALSLSLQF